MYTQYTYIYIVFSIWYNFLKGPMHPGIALSRDYIDHFNGFKGTTKTLYRFLMALYRPFKNINKDWIDSLNAFKGTIETF